MPGLRGIRLSDSMADCSMWEVLGDNTTDGVGEEAGGDPGRRQEAAFVITVLLGASMVLVGGGGW